MDPATIRRRVETLLERLFDPALFESHISGVAGIGAFDSVAALQLVLELEREFQIVIADGDITAENFKTLDALVCFVSSKVSSRPSPM